jgi:hypothetical protein
MMVSPAPLCCDAQPLMAKAPNNNVTSADGAGPIRFAFVALVRATTEFFRSPE